MTIKRLYVEYFTNENKEEKTRHGITVQGKQFLQNIEILQGDFHDLTKSLAIETGIGKGQRLQVNEYLLRITYEVL